MKLTILATSFLTAVVAVSATALPEQSKLADGLYKSHLDDAGNEVTHFVPWDQLGNSTYVPIVQVLPSPKVNKRSILAKRKEGCHPDVNRPSSETDQANKCLIDSFANDPIVTTANGYKRFSCVKGNSLSYICSYNRGPIIGVGSTTRKWKSDIKGSWDYVKRTLCGNNRLGYAQVINGEGDVTAGYTYNGDKYCW
ncbi:hypothetical protein FSPOR_8768 [Fusarium sporotrichioides]|uniref:Secreted protein n=1 Tax=Fusarium sporotrichioides TaxID=5514 RepID=A0A395RSR0_FUSSP|nr:hypothetical protein FSPOR_8768 [Fusarium sporotrichioides]